MPPAARPPVVIRPTGGPVSTGSDALDAALDGGLPKGSILLLSGEVGAGANEMALAAFRRAALEGRGARYATALRAPSRVLTDLAALFPGEEIPGEVVAVGADGGYLLDGLGEGSVLVLESASALARNGDRDLVALVERACDEAEEAGVVVLLLHVPGTLPAVAEQRIAERVDGTLAFAWRDGGPVRRRLLWLPRLRGLPAFLEAEEVPLFEVGVRRGEGLTLSRVKSVL